jgi:hypothetical protein
VVGPIVINRIMYHPLDYALTNNKVDEFIELLNISNGPVALFDSAIPTNTWHLRGSVSFDFPQGLIMNAGDTLVLANTDPSDPKALAAFRAKYSISAPVYGPYSGALPNDVGSVEILRPGDPVLGVVPYIRVEKIDYEATSPWPSLANGTGKALQRLRPTAYGNDPTNWIASGSLAIWIPPADVATRPSSNTVFSVLATSDAPITYQWMHAGTNLINDTVFSGVNTSKLLVTGAQAPAGGDYTVIVSDGATTATSGPATLTLLINPAIIQQPVAQTIVQGDTLYLNVQTANNATLPLTYVWQNQTVAFQTNVSSAFADAIAIPNVRSNLNIRVVIKNRSIPSGVISGSAAITVLADSDGDHIPDVWETSFGFNPQDPSDAALDSDGDSASNLQEFRAGTDPHDPQNYFHMTVSVAPTSDVALQLMAVTNHTYTIQFRDALDSGSWSNLINVPAQPTSGPVNIVDPGAAGVSPRFYRAITPAVP